MADRFCSQCGAELVAAARFCTQCGHALGATTAAASIGRFRFGRWAPVAVFGAVLVAGAAAVLAGRSNPVPPPSIPGRGDAAGSPPAQSAPMPEGHPPIEIPADVVKAIEEMKKQADAAPDDVALWSRLAGVQYRAGLLDKRYLPDAAKSFEYVLAKDPQNLDALRFLGNIAFDQQLPVRAIDYYLRYLTLKPDDYSVMTDMATMYLARGDANTAVQFYNQVLSKQPQFFEALFNLGIAERSRGNNQAALVAFEKAKAAAPDERGKAQVDQVIARAAPSGGEAQGEAAAPGGSAGAPAAAAAPGDFRGGVEGIFRNHPMIGPKLERVEWESDGKARVLIREFPMAGMPPEIRKRFTDRLKTQVRERKQANQVTAAVTLELVDPATGSVMETLVE